MQVKVIGTEVAILNSQGREVVTLTAVEALELLRELDLEKDSLDSIVYAQLEEDEEQEIVPTIGFEYDLSYYGGDYNKSGACAHVPVALIQNLGEEEAFERVTGINRCHIIHYNEEEDEAYGEEQTPDDLEFQRRNFAPLALEHYEQCNVCERAMKRQK